MDHAIQEFQKEGESAPVIRGETTSTVKPSGSTLNQGWALKVNASSEKMTDKQVRKDMIQMVLSLVRFSDSNRMTFVLYLMLLAKLITYL
jgi:hypothetical protein